MANAFSTVMNPDSAFLQFLGRMGSLPGKRYDDFMEQTRRYQEGEIGIADQMLQGGANAVGMLTDIPLAAAGEALGLVGDAANFITFGLLEKGLSDLAEGISETEAAQVAMQYAAENPQMMKRLGYVADLSVVPATRVAKGGMLQDLSLEASNRQPFFYGSGKLGQGASVVATAPTAVIDTLRPSAAASRRAGTPMSVRRSAAVITPERRETAREIEQKRRSPERRAEAARVKDIKKEIEADKDRPQGEKKVTEADRKFLRQFEAKVDPENKFMKSYNNDLSFVEGQLDQTQLISRGRGTETQGIVRSFEKVQQLDGGKLDSDLLEKSASLSKSMSNNNIQLDKDNYAVFEERIRKAQKIGPTEDVEVVIRNPKAFSDLEKETIWAGSGSKSSRRVLAANKAIKKHMPFYDNMREFDIDELKEIVAMTKLPDDTLYNLETKQKASALEKKIYAWTESDKYGRKTSVSDSKLIDQYYKYKKMDLEGKRLTKPQQEKYDGMKARIAEAMEKMDVRGDSIYFSDSHKSAAKGLGGVNDQYMINKKGDFVAIIDDENDLFGMTVPGDKRVISITPPQGMNLFETVKKGTVNKEQQQLKQVFQEELAEMGAEPVSKTPKGMLEQAAVGIQRQDIPKTQLSDYRNLAAAGALTTGASRER